MLVIKCWNGNPVARFNITTVKNLNLVFVHFRLEEFGVIAIFTYNGYYHSTGIAYNGYYQSSGNNHFHV